MLRKCKKSIKCKGFSEKWKLQKQYLTSVEFDLAGIHQKDNIEYRHNKEEKEVPIMNKVKAYFSRLWDSYVDLYSRDV